MKYPNRSIEYKLLKQGYKTIAGIDEAGRGALAGPVVAATVVLDVKKCRLPLKDSKLLTFNQREELYEKIIDESLGHGIGIITPRMIDKKGIGNANRLAMEKAVESLSIDPDYLLIDYFKINTTAPFENIKRGDYKVYSIAAASIIAKVTRDRILINYQKRFPKFSFEKHKGYGTKKHLCELQAYGATRVHRKSFYPVAKFA